MWKPVSRNLDVAIFSLLQQYPKKHVIIATRTTVSYLSRIGRRYDPRHGPSIYKNPHEDNTRLEGAEFDKHYRTRDDVEIDFTDRRIDTLKNPSSADSFYFRYYQSRQFARDVYVRNGERSGVNPSICFPDKQELQKLRQLLDEERSVSEMLAEVKAEEQAFQSQLAAREAKMQTKLSQMHEMVRDWKENEKTEKEAAEKKAKKTREYNERIRQQYGNRFPPHSYEHAQILEFLHAQDLEVEEGKGPKLKGKAKKEAKRKQLEAAVAAAQAKNTEHSGADDSSEDVPPSEATASTSSA